MSKRSLVLIIDDEPQIRRFLRISLVSQGFGVIEAASGADGLAQSRRRGPTWCCSILACRIWIARRCWMLCVPIAPCR